jgi:hypothetical protein
VETVTLEEVEEVESGEGAEDNGRGKGKKRVIHGPSAILPEFANHPGKKHTVRIDVKMLKEAESEDLVRQDKLPPRNSERSLPR